MDTAKNKTKGNTHAYCLVFYFVYVSTYQKTKEWEYVTLRMLNVLFSNVANNRIESTISDNAIGRGRHVKQFTKEHCILDSTADQRGFV